MKLREFGHFYIQVKTEQQLPSTILSRKILSPTDIERQEVEKIDAEIEEMMAICPVSEK